MKIHTEREAGFMTLTVTWEPDDDGIAQEAFDEHGVSDGDHVDRTKYEAVRETYAELTADDPDE